MWEDRAKGTFLHKAEKSAHSMYVTTHTTIPILPFTEIQQEMSDQELKFISWLVFNQNIAFIERHIRKKKEICHWEITVICIQTLRVVPKRLKSCITIHLETQNWCLPRKESSLSGLRQKARAKPKILGSADSKSTAQVDSAGETVEPVTQSECPLSSPTSPPMVLAQNHSY